MVGLYLILLISNWREYKQRLTPMSIAFGIFFVSFGVSTFVGVDWYRSFWDNHERMLGLFTVVHYFLYYVVLSALVRTWRDWRWLLRIFLGAGSLVMFIGFVQKYVNPELLMNNGGDRVSATMGNAIYFSGYGLFLFFIGILLAVKELQKWRGGWFWFAVAGALLGFLGIFWGGTRGTFLALLAGGGVLALTYIFSLKGKKKLKQIFILCIVLCLTMLGILYTYRETAFVSHIPAIGRLLNTHISENDTRIMAWEVAIESWKERPWLGWGPNNFYYAFNEHYRPEFLEHGWGETWFDNAHGVVTNTLAVQGIVGLVSYIAIYIVAIVVLIRAYRRKHIDVHVFAIGISFLTAHFISLLTVFENPTSYLYFAFFLAFVNSQTMQLKEHAEKGSKTAHAISTPGAVMVGIVIALFIYSTNVNPALANKKALKAIQTIATGRLDDAIELYQSTASAPSPHIDDIRNDFSRVMIQDTPDIAEKIGTNDAIHVLQVVEPELRKNMELHPLDIRVNMQLAQLLQLMYHYTSEQSYIEDARSLMADALTLSKKRQQIIYTLSSFDLFLGNRDEAIALLEGALADDENIPDNWWRLVAAYTQIGDTENASRIAHDAMEKEIPFSGPGKDIIDAALALE